MHDWRDVQTICRDVGGIVPKCRYRRAFFSTVHFVLLTVGRFHGFDGISVPLELYSQAVTPFPLGSGCKFVDTYFANDPALRREEMVHRD